MVTRKCILTLMALSLVSCKSKESAGAIDLPKDLKPLDSPARSAAIPVWFPLYPGGKPGSVETTKTPPIETFHRFSITEIPVDCVKVTDWYEEKLKLAGFQVVRNAGWVNGFCDLNLNADGPGNSHGVRMGGGGRDTTNLNIYAIDREMPGAAPVGTGKVPSWVPVYPGSAPSNVTATDFGPEHKVEFSFTTDDDAPKIIAWYEQQLRAAGFSISSAGASDKDYGRLASSKGRSIFTIRVEPTGAKRSVFAEAREGVQ
jgi:hypothetical protein